MSSMLAAFMNHLNADDDMGIGHAPKQVQKWLETLGLPMDMLRFLQWNWPQKTSQIGHIDVLSSADIRKCEFTGPLLKKKLLLLGSAPNGDYFVLDISKESCVPGFVTHEEWSTEAGDARKYFQPIARSMESLLYRVVEGKYIPTDFYEARDFNEFMKKEKASAEQSNRP